MDHWQWILYAAAVFLAVRSLVSLMASHKRQYLQQLILEEQNRRQAAAAEAKASRAKDAAELNDDVAA